MSGPNSSRGFASNSGPEQVAQRHRAARPVPPPRSSGPPPAAGSPAGPASAAAGRPARSCPGRGRCRRPPPRPPYAAAVRADEQAAHRRVARHPVGDVVRADHDHADVRHPGRVRQQPATTWRSRSSDWAPGSATLRSSTGRSATAASPDASSAPGVCRARRTPWPAAVESPSRTSAAGARPGPANATPVQPVRARRVRAAGRRPPAVSPAGPRPAPAPPPPRPIRPIAAAAVRRARRDPPCHPRPRHPSCVATSSVPYSRTQHYLPRTGRCRQSRRGRMPALRHRLAILMPTTSRRSRRHTVQFHDSMISLVGNTPLVRLQQCDRGHSGDRPGQGRVLQPRRLGEGPHRRCA